MKYETHENIDDEVDEDDLYNIEKMRPDEKLWRKRAFEIKLKNTYDIKIPNVMTRIHGEKVNKITECNLIHDIINPSKRTKISNIHKYPILHGCMNRIFMDI